MEKYTYGCVITDVTSNCNLRCKFCGNDWKNTQGNINMSEETFQKCIELVPLAMKDGFFISCLYEPTIHPNFIGLLKKMPIDGKQNAFFTTNLTNELSIDALQELSHANINHINISLDSLHPKTFTELRRGAKFETFIKNLRNMVSVFKQNLDAPQIWFITMILKQNLEEIENLAKICHNEYLAYGHEFRTPFKESLPYIEKDWAEKSLISRKEWDILNEKLLQLPMRIRMYNPPPSESNEKTEDKSNNVIPSQTLIALDIRIESDGTCRLPGTPQSFNINDIEKPYDFFKKKLNELLRTHFSLQIDESEIDKLKKALENKESQIVKLSSTLENKESQIRNLNIQLQQIQNGTGMKLLRKYRRLINKLLGTGKIRRYCYEFLMKCIRGVLTKDKELNKHKNYQTSSKAKAKNN